MKKWLIVGILGAVALVVVLKKTNVTSYASTLMSQVSKDAQDQVPTKFELERIRGEIGALDGDISQMIRPIAEYKYTIEKMRKDIAKSEKNIEERKKNLLTVLEELDANKKFVINDRTVSHEQVRKQLARDTEALKQIEKHVKVQQQVLEGKENALKATQEQLAKVVTKKREYEIRLSQLEAEEESLKVMSVGADLKIDPTRAAQIEEALAAIEKRQSVARHELTMKTEGDIANINLQDRNRTAPDINAIRSYLEGTEQPTEKSASNK